MWREVVCVVWHTNVWLFVIFYQSPSAAQPRGTEIIFEGRCSVFLCVSPSPLEG